MSEFVRGMSSASELDLWLDYQTYLYHYFNFVNHRIEPIFANLATLQIYSDGTVWKDLFFTMLCFPNLKHLRVSQTVGDGLPMEYINWCVPHCLVSKLETIKLWVKGIIFLKRDWRSFKLKNKNKGEE